MFLSLKDLCGQASVERSKVTAAFSIFDLRFVTGESKNHQSQITNFTY